MKRKLGWTSLFLALTAACGDDTATGDSRGTAESSGTGDDAATTSDPTMGMDTTGSTGEAETTSSSTTGDTDETGDTEEPPMGVLEHFGGGQSATIDLEGSYAYVGIGPRITVWDLTDPSSPQLAGRSEALPGLVTGIAVHGDLAYATSWLDLEGELYVLDLSDPIAPKTVGTIDYTASPFSVPTDVKIDGPTLFVSDMEVGIISLDLEEPEKPTVVDTLEVFGVQDIDVEEGRLHYRVKGFVGADAVGAVTHADGVMTPLGTASLPDPGMAVAFEGDTVYNAGLFGFFAYDLSDPEVATTVFSDSIIGTSVRAAADVAYNFGDVLTVFDFTEAEPSQGLSVLAPTGRTTASTLEGDRLMGVTEHGVGLLFDVSSALLPNTNAVFDLPVSAPTAVDFADGNMAFADFYTGLRIVDPVDGSSVGRYRIFGSQTGVEDLEVVGNLAYLADWSSGLHIVDISDPGSPTLVRHVETPGFPSAVTVAGELAFVGESSGGGAVRVVDVSDPAAAEIVGGIVVTHVGDLVHRDGLVYVADKAVLQIGGLRVIDVSNPENPAQIAHYTTCESALSIALEGPRAYVPCADDDRLHIIDVSTPAAPVLVQSVDLGVTGVWSVALTEGRAWVGYGMGIVEVDLSSQDDAVVLYDYPTAVRVQRISVRDETVFGIAGMAGTYRIDPG